MKTIFGLIFLMGMLVLGYANASPTNPDPPCAEFQIVKSDNVANAIETNALEMQKQNFEAAVQFRIRECSFIEPLFIEKANSLPTSPVQSIDLERPGWRI